MNEQKMLLSFLTISRQGTKRGPHNIKGTNIRSNNLRMMLSRDCTTRRPISRATRTAYMQRYTSNTLHERAYTECTTHNSSVPDVDQESSLGPRALRDRAKPLSILMRLSHHATTLPEPSQRI